MDDANTDGVVQYNSMPEFSTEGLQTPGVLKGGTWPDLYAMNVYCPPGIFMPHGL